jgi:hypothetical protein
MATAASPSKQPKPALLRGACHCGQVKFSVATSDLTFAGLCHCTICQTLLGGPCSAFVGFKDGSMHLEQGQDVLVKFSSSEGMDRFSCNVCGTQMYGLSKNPASKFWDAPLGVFERFTAADEAAGAGKEGSIKNLHDLQWTSHMFYRSRVVGDMFHNDGLPKWETYPGVGKPMEFGR